MLIGKLSLKELFSQDPILKKQLTHGRDIDREGKKYTVIYCWKRQGLDIPFVRTNIEILLFMENDQHTAKLGYILIDEQAVKVKQQITMERALEGYIFEEMQSNSHYINLNKITEINQVFIYNQLILKGQQKNQVNILFPYNICLQQWKERIKPFTQIKDIEKPTKENIFQSDRNIMEDIIYNQRSGPVQIMMDVNDVSEQSQKIENGSQKKIHSPIQEQVENRQSIILSQQNNREYDKLQKQLDEVSRQNNYLKERILNLQANNNDNIQRQKEIKKKFQKKQAQVQDVKSKLQQALRPKFHNQITSLQPIAVFPTKQINPEKEKSENLSDYASQFSPQKHDTHVQVEPQFSLQRQLEDANQRIRQLEREVCNHMFQGQVLQNSINQKIYLRKTLQDHIKKNIKCTKFLYRHDPLNKTNCHLYIDNHPHILVVARLTNGRTIAAYSEDPITNQATATGSGLLFSLTDQKSFTLMKGKRSVTYDTFFIIFGNAEFRLKTGQLKFFSNLGIGSGFFQAEGCKHTALTGDTGRDTELTMFEFFQIEFE